MNKNNTPARSRREMRTSCDPGVSARLAEGPTEENLMNTCHTHSRIGRVAAVSAVVVAGTLAGVVGMGTLQAQTAPPPIAVELLTSRAEFTGDVNLQIRNKQDGHATEVSSSKNPSRTVVAKITVQPGAQFPWHTHPGPVIVNIAAGELSYIMAHDCVERSYDVGTAFVDPGRGMVHTAINRTSDVTVLIATFFEVPQTGPLTITQGVEAPTHCTP